MVEWRRLWEKWHSEGLRKSMKTLVRTGDLLVVYMRFRSNEYMKEICSKTKLKSIKFHFVNIPVFLLKQTDFKQKIVFKLKCSDDHGL